MKVLNTEKNRLFGILMLVFCIFRYCKYRRRYRYRFFKCQISVRYFP